MNLQQKTRRFGAWLIFCSLLLRLHATGVMDNLAAFLSKPNIASVLIYLETGRHVRFSFPPDTHAVESAAPWSVPETLPAFAPEQAADLQLHNLCDLSPDLEALLQQPLQWYLTLPEPTVLILHAHATEGYSDTGSSGYRSREEEENMISIGDHVAQVLARHGITAIHDRTLHDHPDYNASYGSARASAQSLLAQYPSIQLILDLHRDALEQDGKQLAVTATAGEKSCAQLMLVMGTNAGGLAHANWQQNLSLGLKLQTQLEQLWPGITRPMQLRTQRFNQDLLPGALLVEVGAAGNSHREALLAAEQLAHAIVALAKGTQ